VLLQTAIKDAIFFIPAKIITLIVMFPVQKGSHIPSINSAVLIPLLIPEQIISFVESNIISFLLIIH